MSEDSGTQQEVEVVSGDKKLKLRGSDLLTSVIGMIVCSGLLLLWFVLDDHRVNAKEDAKTVVQAVKEMTQAQKEAVQQQRVLNCLLATPEKDREAKLTICERMAK